MNPVVVPQKSTPFCQQAYKNWHTLGDTAELDGVIAVGTIKLPNVSAVFATAATI